MAERRPTESSNIAWPADLDTNDYHGWYMGRGNSVKTIVKAAMDGDLEIVKDCVEKEPELVDCNIHYREPLYFAVGNNHLDVADYLIEKGAEITYKSGNRTHQRAIQRGEDRGFTEMVNLLKSGIEQKYDVLYRPEGEEIAKLIRDKNLPAVLELLDRSPKTIRAVDERGNQPIHWAVLVKSTKIIDALLSRGANIETQRPDGARPIDLTVGDYFFRGSSVSNFLCGYLVGKGAHYAIEHAASQSDLERIKELVESDPEIVNRLPDYFTWYTNTTLNNAVKSNSTQTVKYLLKKGADPNLRQPGFAPDGNALMGAIAKGNMELARLLLDADANPNQAVESSSNCCGWAKKHPDLLKELAEKGGQFGDWENLKDVDPDLLITMYGDIPARYYVDNDDAKGLTEHLTSTPEAAHQIFPQTLGKRHLMDICLKADPKLLEKLSSEFVRNMIKNESASDLWEQAIEHTDLSRPNWMGATDLHDIAAYGSLATAEPFVKHGANLEAVDEEYSSTPLAWAAREGKTEMVEFLLEQGANPKGFETFEWASPLAWAQKRDHVETAQVIEQYL